MMRSSTGSFLTRNLPWTAFAASAMLLGSEAASALGVPLNRSLSQRLLLQVENGPWLARRPSGNSCPKLYMLDSRSCPYCQAFMKRDYQAFEQAGYDVRIHYAAVARENAGTLAEIALRRDIRALLNYQLADRPITGPDPTIAGGRRLDALNAMIETTKAIGAASRAAGYSAYLPTFIWRDKQDQWRIASGLDDKTASQLRASLPVPSSACR